MICPCYPWIPASQLTILKRPADSIAHDNVLKSKEKKFEQKPCKKRDDLENEEFGDCYTEVQDFMAPLVNETPPEDRLEIWAFTLNQMEQRNQSGGRICSWCGEEQYCRYWVGQRVLERVWFASCKGRNHQLLMKWEQWRRGTEKLYWIKK